LVDLAQLKGIHALRLNQLFHGEDFDDLKIPPQEIFTSNAYKHHHIEDMSVERLQKCVRFNSFADHSSQKIEGQLFCFTSFYNHDKLGSTIEMNAGGLKDFNFVVALRDIEEGEELKYDYKHTILDLEERANSLKRHGIIEE
jgi:SET domain-containing protein